MANILFGKIGRSIGFDESKWSSVGGDNEAPYLLYTLAKHYPNNNYYIIGKSDFSKVYPNGNPEYSNIIDLWNKKFWNNININSLLKEENKESDWKYFNYIYNILEENKIKPDFGILLFGIIFKNSISFNSLKKTDNKNYIKPLFAAKGYSAPIIWTINKLNIPWFSIITDPRQCIAIEDCINYPILNMSQIKDEFIFHSSFKSTFLDKKENITKDKLKLSHCYTELINLLSRKPYEQFYNLDENWFKEKQGFNIICNEGLPGSDKKEPQRLTELKKFILKDKDLKCNIFGKWNEKYTKNDDRFKGTIHPNDLGSVLEKTKYTFCIPIDKGWTTSKFIEMIHFGVIPFLHKDYASKCKPFYIDEFFYVKSKDELFEKINLLENNFDLYMEKIKLLHSKIFLNNSFDLYDGNFLSKIFKLFCRKNNLEFFED